MIERRRTPVERVRRWFGALGWRSWTALGIVATAFLVTVGIRVAEAPRTSGAQPGMQWVAASEADLEFQVPVDWTVVPASGTAASASDAVWAALRDQTGESADAGIPPRSTIELLTRSQDLSSIEAVGVTSVPVSSMPTVDQVAAALKQAGVEHDAPTAVSTPLGPGITWTTVADNPGGPVTPTDGSVTPTGGPVTPTGGPVTPTDGSVPPASDTASPGPGPGPSPSGFGATSPMTAHFRHLLVPTGTGVADVASVAFTRERMTSISERVLATLRHPL